MINVKPNIHQGLGSHASLRDGNANDPTYKIYCSNLAVLRHYIYLDFFMQSNRIIIFKAFAKGLPNKKILDSLLWGEPKSLPWTTGARVPTP
ncbi:hypothetical protein NIES4072_49150 [Nostoc commune NIES-4072]|uniref:Uncharacterized protein n=1 Tax=Nostoc commune NIES-4072 TaxID=2005467 RepID=A0A2R5FZF9_NOSCO|nr:hypothetical protein NIES4070_41800 [Nostoc commune HK-02]GBG21231.1 hypothetical protein NIES4072_49150 [Nostoc commune NIES-4072]